MCVSLYIYICIYIYGGFHKWGVPNSWLVFVRENPTKMDDDWGYPYFRKPPISQDQHLQGNIHPKLATVQDRAGKLLGLAFPALLPSNCCNSRALRSKINGSQSGPIKWLWYHASSASCKAGMTTWCLQSLPVCFRATVSKRDGLEINGNFCDPIRRAPHGRAM